MRYEVKLHPKVQRFLDKLDKHIAERIRARLRVLRDDPFLHLEHYEGDGCYKFRLGDYRALVDVDKTRQLVLVRVLDHRSRIYKRT